MSHQNEKKKMTTRECTDLDYSSINSSEGSDKLT
nr:MAG TPA: hypothetical protein [Caudoviricetes sp.]